MKLGIAVAALIAALATYAVLESDGPNPELDRLEDVFTESACGPDGSLRETNRSKRYRDWFELRRPGPRFERYLEQTEPELTVIGCRYSGPALRYVEFANRDEVGGAQRAYRDDRRVCVLGTALFDVVGDARGLLPDYCDELDGRLIGAPARRA